VLQVLSETFGFDNGMGSGSTRKVKGITGKITLSGTDITDGEWNMRPYLAGEILQVYTDKGSQSVTWSSDLTQAGPVTWYQTEITIPSALPANSALLLDATGLNRGHTFFNGFDLGRYWTLKMNDDSGNPTQRLYLIPQDIIKVGNNVITLIEVLGATEVTKPRLILRKMVPTMHSAVYAGIDTCPF